MVADVFAALAEPTRRGILEALRENERSVSDLVDDLQVSQPTVSKHLKVLREHGFVTCRTAAQQRIYRLDQTSFAAIDAWLAPYRQMWDRHLDALERHLDSMEKADD